MEKYGSSYGCQGEGAVSFFSEKPEQWFKKKKKTVFGIGKCNWRWEMSQFDPGRRTWIFVGFQFQLTRTLWFCQAEPVNTKKSIQSQLQLVEVLFKSKKRSHGPIPSSSTRYVVSYQGGCWRTWCRDEMPATQRFQAEKIGNRKIARVHTRWAPYQL